MLGSETTDGNATQRNRNALLAWVLVASMAVAVLASALRGDYLWAGFGVASILLALIPVFAFRRPTAMIPWESLLAVALGLISVPLGSLLPRSIATFVAVAGLALVVAVELDTFTAVELSPFFAVLFVVVATMASAGLWAVVQWTADGMLGTQNLRSLSSVMWSLLAATGAGIVAGVVFAVYFRRVDTARFGFRPADGRARTEGTTAVGATEGWNLSETRQRQVVRAFQLVLVGVLLFGLFEVNVGIIVNTAVALVLTEVPALLERNYGLPMDTRLTLWIVVPVFLHAIGTVGLYQSIGLWDQLTHALSSSVVAAAGYTVVRALDVHADSIYLPKEFMFVFILLFTLAFGVLWELLEFGLDGIASTTGTESVLAQYSLGNTMLDLVFDTVGGVVVALWGARYLSHVSDALASETFES
ncbi:hypothetical protein SAMN05421858_4169 [Haladaptatus litoreus]|uniref:DUF2238 domain-containing protein n=1 Tax=Haladaptatus litoreus TaxID=553468 RepID=A0A1N7EAD6_9EURY|nr:hypothetical protein SAMN05421858_4169 [Haladaptatus litoreus]